jgi:hypothetical protein
MERVRVKLFAIGLAVALVACGSDTTTDTDGATDGASDSAEVTTTQAAATETDDGAEPAEDAPEPSQDASQIDWATVDLTTIDWETIDMSQVDFTAIQENPTAANLEAETVSLIGSRMNPGSATLTIGDQTWEFDSFLCAFGHDATQSDVYSFSSDTRGDHEGVRVQVQANIRDSSGAGRFEGADLSHDVFITDVTNLGNPIIDLSFNAPEGIRIDGNDLTAEGQFDDKLTEEIEAIPGTLVARCGDGSRR